MKYSTSYTFSCTVLICMLVEHFFIKYQTEFISHYPKLIELSQDETKKFFNQNLCKFFGRHHASKKMILSRSRKKSLVVFVPSWTICQKIIWTQWLPLTPPFSILIKIKIALPSSHFAFKLWRILWIKRISQRRPFSSFPPKFLK